ncbi:MAG: bifunctional [glutamate--ammonia ligase]-adenylyl-L-tyrosine phosphorylase/[glutamate--ammonia-ligase] adenylyltransferase [Nitrospina sp.]|nr:bifunctional [glutamate--ammonia ligase]-adenylyl-L-tyrosine phosphorylase/[glutamate--ammonia-ligase] adenylyltransferase [Nitrospina sp.]
MVSTEHLVSALCRNAPWEDGFSSSLTSLGLEDPRDAWTRLSSLAILTDFENRYPGFLPGFLDHLGNCYDADLALNNFLRLTELLTDREHLFSLLTTSEFLLEALLTLFSGSQVLTDTLLANPTYVDWLSLPETLIRPKTRDLLYRDFYALAGRDTLPANTPELLRRFKKREYIRIGLRDLMHKVTLEENVENLSDLADVCLQVAYEFCNQTLQAKHGVPIFTDEDGTERESEFAILSMGKLGGRELNYSSDIDLIYIYTSSSGQTRPLEPEHSIRQLSCHEFHTRLGQMITKTIHDITNEGSVFRVDLDLRPEGPSGEIANSLTRCETYYQSWGRTWERQAMIKARVSAGSEALGREFFEMITPFVYRRSLDFSAIEEVKKLKGKIDLDLASKKKEKGHIKLGAGGIREIEFLVQAYQLLFGGRDQTLRDTATLKTLRQLKKRKFLDEEAYRGLREAYIFLRNLENRVQISFGLQTYHLPTDEKGLDVLARKMGMEGPTRQGRIGGLMERFRAHTGLVNEMFQNLFTEEEDQAKAQRTHHEWGVNRDMESRFSEELMREYAFAEPDRVFRFLKSLRDGPKGVPPSEKSLKTFYGILPSILELSGRAAFPNSAVENLVKFIEASQAREMFFSLFLENEKILELFLILLGSGELLSSILIRQPSLMDVLMNPDLLYRYKTQAQMKQELEARLAACAGEEERLEALRRFKQAEELRIGIRYLIRETDLVATLEDLSRLADLFLETAVALAAEEVRAELEPGFEGTGSFAVLGMGKLGGHELNFSSDLDIVFAYDEEEALPDAMRLYSALSQKLYKYCSQTTPAGIAYKVDTELRPEGNQGALILSLKGYQDYFQARGRIWERQAMTRARFVAGNPRVGKRFLEIAQAFTYSPRLDYGSLIEIARLRERMEMELAQEAKKGKNVKLGYGGLADIEFTVQILQLIHGERASALRATNTLEGLKGMAQLGFMDEREAETMRHGYLFLRSLECVLRLYSERSANTLPKDPALLAGLARMLGFVEETESALVEALQKSYEEHTDRVRALYRKTMDRLLRNAR